MRNFKAAISDPNCFINEPGSRFHIQYTGFVFPDGSKGLKPIGKVDIQAEINSHRDECDMAIILAKLANGDTSMVHDGMYGDFTQIPHTMAGIYQLVSDSKAKFDLLPEDVRRKFDFDVAKWFASAGSDSWYDAMGYNRVNTSGSAGAPSSDPVSDSGVGS